MVRTPSLAADVATSFRLSLARTGEGTDAGWIATLEDDSGHAARGATPEEAVRQALTFLDARRAEPASASEDATEASEARHSGRLLVRMPATLHDELARAAEREGVSLNQMITGVLAGAVEWRAVETLDHAASATPAKRPETRSPSGILAAVPMRVALAANFVLVALTGALAIALLVVAWQQS